MRRIARCGMDGAGTGEAADQRGQNETALGEPLEPATDASHRAPFRFASERRPGRQPAPQELTEPYRTAGSGNESRPQGRVTAWLDKSTR